MVTIHAITMLPAKPQRTAETRLAAPTPMMAPVIVCVVEGRRAGAEAPRRHARGFARAGRRDRRNDLHAAGVGGTNPWDGNLCDRGAINVLFRLTSTDGSRHRRLRFRRQAKMTPDARCPLIDAAGNDSNSFQPDIHPRSTVGIHRIVGCWTRDENLAKAVAALPLTTQVRDRARSSKSCPLTCRARSGTGAPRRSARFSAAGARPHGTKPECR